MKQDDWRLLRGQELYLNGVVLVKQQYKPSDRSNDHDHCEFCMEKFCECEGALNFGYSTTDRKIWICPQCFEDFYIQFGWTVREQVATMKNHNTQKQVRQNPRIFIIVVPAFLVIETLLIIVGEVGFTVIPAFVFVITIISVLNDKMIYDDSGITLSNIVGHKFFIPWRDVISVENTFEDPRLCRGAPGRIIKILYINRCGETESAKFGFHNNIGVVEFLTYYWGNIENKNHN